jgi:hypothetical protein
MLNMKKFFINKIINLTILVAALSVTFLSCKKDSDGRPDISAGNPVSAGIDPGEAAGGEVLTLKGSGLGDIRSIVFEKNNVPAPFMSTLNTESAIVFRVPDTAFGGQQNIIFTNSAGRQLTVPFKVIALPSVTEAFPTDFESGSTVTLKGNNLDDVSKVVLAGTTEQATIVSKARKELVMTMPTSAVDRAKLTLTNESGTRTTDIEFANVSKAAMVFKDAYENKFESWSWGGDFTASGDDKITGEKSLKAAYDPAGTWGGMQLGGGNINITGYKYFAFWVKGADIDKNVQFWLNWAGQKVITVPAKKWTYFRFELATGWPGLTNVDNVTFQIQNEGKTLYFDNIMFIK